MPDTNSTNGVWFDFLFNHALSLKQRWCREPSLLGGKIHLFLAKHFLLCVALLCIGSICLADGKFFWGISFTIVGFASAILAGKKTIIISFIAAAFGALHHYSLLQKQTAAMRDFTNGHLATIQAVVHDEAKPSGRGWSAECVVRNSSFPSLTNAHLIWNGTGMPPAVGDEVSADGRLQALPRIRNEGEFNHGDVLYRRNICGYFQATNTVIQHQENFFSLLRMSHWREKFEQALTLGIENDTRACAVIQAMVLGEYPRNQDAAMRVFRESGTLHVFSVSGQHVSYMAIIVWFVLKLCRVPRRVAVWIMIPFVFCYAWITGASAPAMRAAMMVALIMIAFFCQRKANYMHLLTLLFIITILWNGHLLFHPGVQLSYSIVAALIVGASFLHDKIMKMKLYDAYLPKDLYTKSQKWSEIISKKLLSTTSSSGVATLGSLPLCVAHFGMVAPVSVLTSLLLFYPVAACLSLGLLAAALAPFSDKSASFVNHVNAYVASTCVQLCSACARIPGGHFPLSLHTPSEDNIRIYDIPHGGAAVAVQSDHYENLLDCGSSSGFKNIVLPAARYFGDSPNTLILSHGDVAHIGGADFASEQLDIEHYILPAAKAKSGSLKKFTQKISQTSLPVFVAKENATWNISKDAYWQIIYAADPWDIHSAADDRVCVMMLHFHQWKILFINDAGKIIWEHLSKKKQISADVLVMGHNDTTPYISEEFLTQVSPKAAICTHANFPKTESILPYTEKLFAARGIHFFHQGKCGMVKISSPCENELVLSGFLNQQSVSLKR